jgi:hypothetical protein
MDNEKSTGAERVDFHKGPLVLVIYGRLVVLLFYVTNLAIQGCKSVVIDLPNEKLCYRLFLSDLYRNKYTDLTCLRLW